MTRTGSPAARRHRPAFLTLAALALGCAEATNPELYAGSPTVVDDSVLVFPSGERFVPGLAGVAYLGRLEEAGAPPILVLAGAECSACDAPPSVLLRSPAEGRLMAFRDALGLFAYPGRIRSYPDTTTVVRETRLFFGQCVDDAEPGAIEFGAEFAGNQRVRETVRSVQLRGGALIEEDIGASGVRRLLEEALSRVGRRICHEVPPRHRYVDP